MKNVLYNSRIESSRTQKNILYSLMIFSMGAIVGGFAGVFIFIYITGGSALPSEPISAPQLSLEPVDNTNLAQEAVNKPNPSNLVDVETNEAPIVPVPEVDNESGETTITNVSEVDNGSEAATIASGAEEVVQPADVVLSQQLYRIVPEQSEARFSVYETFPEGTAIGRTNQIAGDMIVDFNNPANSQLGTIRINLRTLRTGDLDRDRSIRCCVLLTAQPEYEFTDFIPTSISDLPTQVELGQTATFQVTGGLTLRGVTRSVTFDVNLTVVDADELLGFATTTVNRSGFGILNDADNGFDYHGVEEKVILEFDFVARAVSE